MLAWLVVLGLFLQVSGKDDLLRCSIDGKPGTVCKCGKKTIDPSRIIGGQDAEVNEYPWMVLLLLFYDKINFIGSDSMEYCTKTENAFLVLQQLNVPLCVVSVGRHSI